MLRKKRDSVKLKLVLSEGTGGESAELLGYLGDLQCNPGFFAVQEPEISNKSVNKSLAIACDLQFLNAPRTIIRREKIDPTNIP
jgi:hypothetical protein